MALMNISFDEYKPLPLLIVISGPSGVGKDSVLKELKSRDGQYQFVVTATSRPPRPGEIHGVDYFFVTKDSFEAMIRNNELIEHNLVYSDYKGIPRAQVRAALATGKDTILRVDVQGAARVRELCPEAVMIFLIPDNADVWYRRLKNRKTETEEELNLRVETARHEMTRLSEFDYIVVNAEDRLDEAVDNIEAIINAEHHRIPHRIIMI